MIFNQYKNRYNHSLGGSILVLICGLFMGNSVMADECPPDDTNCVQVTGVPLPGTTPVLDDDGMEGADGGGMGGIPSPNSGGGGSSNDNSEEEVEECDEYEDCVELFGQTLADLMQESYYGTYHSYISSEGESSIALININGIVYLILTYTNEGTVEASAETTPFSEWIIGNEWGEGG